MRRRRGGREDGYIKRVERGEMHIKEEENIHT